MADAHTEYDPIELVFQLSEKASTATWLWFGGGAAAFAVAFAGFFLAIISRVDQLSMHLMSTLPAIVGTGALAAAWVRIRTPREVGVGPDGVRIERRSESQTYSWRQIGWSTVQPGPINGRRNLKIYDVDGRQLAKLSDAMSDFDALAESIAAGIAAKGDDTAQRIQIAKAKRTAVFMAIGGVALFAVACSVAWMTKQDVRAARLLEDSGVPIEARIEDRRLAPNGVTPRLVYQIIAPDGRTATRNVEVMRPVWDALDGAETVEVIYVPDEPSISRLAFGEADNRDLFNKPLIGYGLPALVAAMSIFFLVAACLMWRGWDINFDSKTRRFSIKRFGSVR